MGKKDRKKKTDNRIQIPGAPPGTFLPPGMTLEQFQHIMQQKIMQQQMHQGQMAARQRAMEEHKKALEVKKASETEEPSEESSSSNSMAKIVAAPAPAQQKVQQAPQQAPPQGHPAQGRQQIRRPPPPSWYRGEDRSQSICIYPIYINKDKTVAGGRRIPKEIAISRPHVQEMFLVLQHAGFKVIGIQKLHPRDTFKGDPCNFGRLHVLFKNPDGTPLKPDIAKTKNDLLKYVANKIPQLKSRAFADSMNQGPDLEKLEEAQEQAQQAQQQQSSKPSAKKGNRRKKRK